MHYIIRSESDYFDLEKEKTNPINPVHGISVGEWLSPLLKEKNVSITDIEAEDWGWSLYATLKEREYLIGFVALPDPKNNEPSEIIIQIDKHRTFLEMLLFKNKINEKDFLLKMVHEIINNSGKFKKIELMKVG